MKVFNAIAVVVICAVFVLVFEGCKSKSQIMNAQSKAGDALENIPCENAGMSDKNFFRVSSVATSSDLQLAKDKALLIAKQRMVTRINANIQVVTNRYVAEKELVGDAGIVQKFEFLVRQVADDVLTKIEVSCEKVNVLEDKKYRAFMAIQVNREYVWEAIHKRVMSDQALVSNYDKTKFQEIFDQEMEKAAVEFGK